MSRDKRQKVWDRFYPVRIEEPETFWVSFVLYGEVQNREYSDANGRNNFRSIGAAKQSVNYWLGRQKYRATHTLRPEMIDDVEKVYIRSSLGDTLVAKWDRQSGWVDFDEEGE